MTAGTCALWIILTWLVLGGIFVAAVLILEAVRARRGGALYFDLPEQQIAFERAVHAEDYAAVIRDIHEHVRQQLKYHDHTEETDACLLAIMEEIGDLCIGHDVDPWEDAE
jgi:hypothetical protein